MKTAPGDQESNSKRVGSLPMEPNLTYPFSIVECRL